MIEESTLSYPLQPFLLFLGALGRRVHYRRRTSCLSARSYPPFFANHASTSSAEPWKVTGRAIRVTARWYNLS